MIPKISSGTSFYGLVAYNSDKVKKGEAELLMKNNMVSDDVLYSLQVVAASNPSCKKNTFHVSLSFPPNEKPSNEVMRNIAVEFMSSMGYGEQPYAVYRHHDTDNDHIHIVSTRVDWEGNRIKDFQENRKAGEIATKIEEKFGLIKVNRNEKNRVVTPVYHLEKLDYDRNNVKGHIANAIGTVLADLGPTDYDSFSSSLKKYGVGIETNEEGGVVYFLADNDGKRVSPPVNASSLHFKPTMKRLTKVFESTATKKKSALKLMKEKFKWIGEYEAISRNTFERFLAKNNLQVDYVKNSGGIYGVNFYDTKRKVFYKGSELGWSWNDLKKVLNESFTIKNNQGSFCVDNLYARLHRSCYRESDFIKNNDVYECLKKEIVLCKNEVITSKLLPMAKALADDKLARVGEIERMERDRYMARAYKVANFMDACGGGVIQKCLVAYAFGYKVRNGALINEKESIEFPLNFDDSISSYVLSKVPKTALKAIKSCLTAIDNKDPKKVPECLMFSPENNVYASFVNVILPTTDVKRLAGLATVNYMQNNLDRLMKREDSLEAVVGGLIHRGISLSVEKDSVVMEINSIKTIINNRRLAKCIDGLPIDLLNGFRTKDYNKLSILNQADMAGQSSGLDCSFDPGINAEEWIRKNFEKIEEAEVKDFDCKEFVWGLLDLPIGFASLANDIGDMVSDMVSADMSNDAEWESYYNAMDKKEKKGIRKRKRR